jgi:hypothetical protein
MCSGRHIKQLYASSMTLYASSMPVVLHSVDDEPVPVVLHETDGTVECNIFQEACRRVEIEGALATWDTAECSYDCMELQCQHKFNACALALHFLTNYMTCPVCRNGLRCKMSLACVPENVKRTYAQHISKPEYSELLEFEPEAFLRDLRLQVDFLPWCAQTGEVLTLVTPCIRDSMQAESDSVFRTHKSFRRLFNSILKGGKAKTCRFSLMHPLVLMSLYSNDMSCDAICGYEFSLPHDIAVVCCSVEHGILTIDLRLNLAVLYSMCVSTVMQYMNDN